MKKDIVFICILGIIFALFIQVRTSGAGSSDFLAYWSASHLVVSGGNPYDHKSLSDLEQSVDPQLGAQGEVFLNTWNPPWLLLLFVPFGLLPYHIAALLWVFCNTLIIGLAIILAWRICTGDNKSRWLLYVFLACYIFGVTIAYLVIGQITALVLIGLLSSIFLIDREQDFLAGASLLLITIKPHIVYFFFLILLVWIIQNRRWKIIAGLAVAVAVPLIAYWIIDPGWIADYVSLLRSMPYSLIYTSTLGSFMSALFNIKIFYFLGILLLLLIRPLLQVLKDEGWLTVLNISLLISLPLSPFGFTFDQIVLLPAIIQVIAWIVTNQLPAKISRIVLACMAAFYLATYWMLSINGLEYYWFFLVPLAFLPIYLVSWKQSQVSPKVAYGS